MVINLSQNMFSFLAWFIVAWLIVCNVYLIVTYINDMRNNLQKS